MSEAKAKKGGGKLNRSQTVTLRLDPRLKYLTDLASRTQRRTTSSFIEWAIEKSLEQVELYTDQNNYVSLADEANKLWDINESDRLVLLGLNYPHLLTLDEQIIWKLITTNLYFWRYLDRTDNSQPDISRESLMLKKVQDNWDLLKAVAEGKRDKSELPSEEKANASVRGAPDDGFDSIPF